MLTDTIVERNSIFLRNLNKSATQDKDVWVSGTGYGFYGIPYETPLILDHYYYLKCQYKFTTTNQSPTWFTMYFQGGGGNGGPSQSNPVANTVYTVSEVKQPIVTNTSAPNSSGTMYNGNSNAISGVTSYVRNVVVYDVTELYYALLAKGAINNTDDLKTWCDANLDYRKAYTNYDITSLVADTGTKISMKEGSMLATNFIECDGMKYYACNKDLDNYVDSGLSGINVYNNNGNGTVTHTRVSAKEQNSPFWPEHPYVLKITTNGAASPGAGGLVLTHYAAANEIFVEKIVAQIPKGYNIQCHYNPQGAGATISFISSTAGTGKWEEYTVLYKCGSSGSFSSGGYLALNGSNNTSVTWYVAYMENCDITGKEYLKDYTALPTKTTFKAGTVGCYNLTNSNIVPNGDCRRQTADYIQSGWSYDTTDVPPGSKARASIVQPVGAGSGGINYHVKICPTTRYKISYWVKCKRDMTSFLTAMCYYTASGYGYTHTTTCYKPYTETTLSEALVSGATQVKVASNANWSAYNYSRLGFRSGGTWGMRTYNDIGTSDGYNGSTGIVKGTSGSNIILLNTAYTGSTIPSGTAIVESYDGGTWPYPIGYGDLPTDNNWKYVEGYFGVADKIWRGDGSWDGIPAEARELYIYLNIYANNGTVPIKYADIRIEPVAGGGGDRHENKIQFETQG